MYSRCSTKRGFTIVELMLAMAFVSILMLSVAVLTISVGNLYSRGVTMKELNRSGSEIITELKREIGSSYAEDVKLITIADSVESKSKILCTGKHSYVVNTAKSLEAGSNKIMRYGYYASSPPPRLSKVKDPMGSLCAEPRNEDGSVKELTVAGASTRLSARLLANAIRADSERKGVEVNELLGGGDRILAIGEINLTKPEGMNTSGNSLIVLDFTLQTGKTNEIDATGRCKAPNDPESGAEYCAINKFKAVIRAGNTHRK